MNTTARRSGSGYTVWPAMAVALAIALPGCAPEEDEKVIRMAWFPCQSAANCWISRWRPSVGKGELAHTGRAR